ncbi:XdhC/CoxI family protein [Hoeflea sp. YIM 152468]|uniref:XdhC family protein n=1 Tax=Hoeflea sp. YIM 152468 TaxID=3031759 RepID=UPI0023DBCD00|nr:XdhC/CoxI family protein [Hoeflea sp. YIM 152468]MDF1606870.1 XdhC/CoxI family protein [Hoeflea sp. YIM 152468]
MNDFKTKGEPFALATVVRTVSVTAAKAGAKAVIRSDGTITEGWIGGGCARGAVLKAARQALADGQSRLVSIQPDEQLSEHQVKAGEVRDGVVYAKNMCPSQGTMDVFVEPVLPRPHLTICGASPVAVALADLGRRMGFFVTICAPEADHASFGETDRVIDGYEIPADGSERDYVVIATQGRGDSIALMAAVQVPSKYLAFVGSRKKIAALKAELSGSGVSSVRLEDIHAPAGLDLGAITPDEIAFSIVAEMIEIRRRGQRTL